MRVSTSAFPSKRRNYVQARFNNGGSSFRIGVNLPFFQYGPLIVMPSSRAVDSPLADELVVQI